MSLDVLFFFYKTREPIDYLYSIGAEPSLRVDNKVLDF